MAWGAREGSRPRRTQGLQPPRAPRPSMETAQTRGAGSFERLPSLTWPHEHSRAGKSGVAPTPANSGQPVMSIGSRARHVRADHSAPYFFVALGRLIHRHEWHLRRVDFVDECIALAREHRP